MKNLIFFSFLVLLSCNSEKREVVEGEDPSQISQKNEIKYAKGFTINKFNGYKVITLKNAWVGEKILYKYVLYENEKPKDVTADVFIKIPIKTIACMSLTHIAFLEKLGVENSIVALSGHKYVSSSKINKQIKNGLINEIGQEQSINYEMLVDISPSIVMGYGIDASSSSYINKMEDLGLEVVLNSEYMERHPLGKLEWIKFIAAFYDENEQATTIFNEIEEAYLSLLAITKKVNQKPTVFTGMPWSGSWYVPGAKSFQVQLFKDAGAQYLWMDNEEVSSIVKSQEIIIDEAFDADFWLNQNSYNSIASITDFDNKFNGFKAIKTKQLFNNNNRMNEHGGNDYWESGVVNPHIVLKDLIKIIHPKLIEHRLYYYKQLH